LKKCKSITFSCDFVKHLNGGHDSLSLSLLQFLFFYFYIHKGLAVGMRPECVVPENQCAIKRKEKKAQKEKDKATTSGPVSSSSPVVHSNRSNNNSEFLKSDFMLNLMKCDPPLHQMTHLLSENLLNENKNKNIPHLTQNQMSVIYKLIWYQDGYEQPSEEDLKRIEEVRVQLIVCRN
jgi:ecdysone receptor